MPHRPICHTGWRRDRVEMPQDGGTGGGPGKVCVVAQLRERDNLRRYRLTRGKERVGRVIGWREAGRKFSQTQLSSSWVEWLRGIDRSWVFCAQTDIWAIESKYRLSFYSGQSVFTAVEAQLSLGNNCPPFFSLSLPPSIYSYFASSPRLSLSNRSSAWSQSPFSF